MAFRLEFKKEEEQVQETYNGSLETTFAGVSEFSFQAIAFVENETFAEEKVQLWGNYRGSRYMVLSQKGTYMTLVKVLGGQTLEVSSCNVSDVTTSPTTQEIICPGDNQCRRKGLRQGPRCSPIRPSEGLLRYPHPI